MIYIGASGFSYDYWKGHFYPDHLSKRDMLAYYAARFNSVEINSSYYTIPGASSFASMAHRTPQGFMFAVKTHKDMTHSDAPDHGAFARFLDSIAPLQDAGKFGCALAQFPWRFEPSVHSKIANFSCLSV